uniref:Putative effector protein n=1 Tax=Heterodera avenae TaxID=34510 RepID=A0A2L0VDG4_HETAV|nr:putative effector protein [Heterodera avenae]
MLHNKFVLTFFLLTCFYKFNAEETECPKRNRANVLQTIVLFDASPENQLDFQQQKDRVIKTLRDIDRFSSGRKRFYELIVFHRTPMDRLQSASIDQITEQISSLLMTHSQETSPAKALNEARTIVEKMPQAQSVILLAHDGHNTDLASETLTASARLSKKVPIFAIAGGKTPPALAKLDEYTGGQRNRVYAFEQDNHQFMDALDEEIEFCTASPSLPDKNTTSSEQPEQPLALSVETEKPTQKVNVKKPVEIIRKQVRKTDEKVKLECGTTSGQVDLVFLLDTSGSIFHTFGNEVALVKSLVSQLQNPIADRSLRVSLISFAERPTMAFSLNDALNGTEMLNRVDQVQFSGGVTQICDAIDKGQKEMEKFGRKGALKIFVLISDGHGHELWPKTLETGKNLREQKMQKFAVSMSADYSKDELMAYMGESNRIFVGFRQTLFEPTLLAFLNECLSHSRSSANAENNDETPETTAAETNETTPNESTVTSATETTSTEASEASHAENTETTLSERPVAAETNETTPNESTVTSATETTSTEASEASHAENTETTPTETTLTTATEIPTETSEAKHAEKAESTSNENTVATETETAPTEKSEVTHSETVEMTPTETTVTTVPEATATVTTSAKTTVTIAKSLPTKETTDQSSEDAAVEESKTVEDSNAPSSSGELVAVPSEEEKTTEGSTISAVLSEQTNAAEGAATNQSPSNDGAKAADGTTEQTTNATSSPPAAEETVSTTSSAAAAPSTDQTTLVNAPAETTNATANSTQMADQADADQTEVGKMAGGTNSANADQELPEKTEKAGNSTNANPGNADQTKSIAIDHLTKEKSEANANSTADDSNQANSEGNANATNRTINIDQTTTPQKTQTSNSTSQATLNADAPNANQTILETTNGTANAESANQANTTQTKDNADQTKGKVDQVAMDKSAEGNTNLTTPVRKAEQNATYQASGKPMNSTNEKSKSNTTNAGQINGGQTKNNTDQSIPPVKTGDSANSNATTPDDEQTTSTKPNSNTVTAKLAQQNNNNSSNNGTSSSAGDGGGTPAEMQNVDDETKLKMMIMSSLATQSAPHSVPNSTNSSAAEQRQSAANGTASGANPSAQKKTKKRLALPAAELANERH